MIYSPFVKERREAAEREELQARVTGLRQQLFENGYQPVGLKKQVDDSCQNATGVPAFDLKKPSTGISCGGLRVIDVDVDDPDMVAVVAEIVRARLGTAPLRSRRGSVRFCALYRAAEGEPRKRTIKLRGLTGDGKHNKIEVLGKGQQVMVDGEHAEGGAYEWIAASPYDTPREDLPAIAVEVEDALETELLALLGPEPKEEDKPRTFERPPREAFSGPWPETTLEDVEAALDALAAARPPYTREDFMKLGYAAWVGSNGMAEDAFVHLRAGYPNFSERNCRSNWRTDFPKAREVTEATLFGEVRNRVRGWEKPSTITERDEREREGVRAFEQAWSDTGGRGGLLPEPPRHEEPKLGPDPDDGGPAGPRELPGELELTDFAAYMPLHNYILLDTGDLWPAASVNARLRPIPVLDAHGQPILNEKGEPKNIKANVWLDQNGPVEQITWLPGAPQIIRNRMISDGGWFDRQGRSVFNLYKPPTVVPRPGDIGPWQEHGRTVYPNDFNHIEKWLAHRVQRPGEKLNHALLLGGEQRIGKDSILVPVRIAVGISNFREVRPQQILSQFNPFLRSVILRVNEVRDMGEYDRGAFYDQMKDIIAAPPEVLGVNDKHVKLHYIPNLCGVVITTNRKANGIHLDAGDGRHYVAWSELTRDSWPEGYFPKLWKWFGEGGNEAVAYHLLNLDLSDFDAKAPPRQTPAFWAIVNASRPPEDAELADALEKLGWPDVTTLENVSEYTSDDFAAWLKDRKNARKIPHRFEDCAYEPVRNEDAKDGLWKVNSRRQVIYGRKQLSDGALKVAASKLTGIFYKKAE